jgi:hypothetical protein
MLSASSHICSVRSASNHTEDLQDLLLVERLRVRRSLSIRISTNAPQRQDYEPRRGGHRASCGRRPARARAGARGPRQATGARRGRGACPRTRPRPRRSAATPSAGSRTRRGACARRASRSRRARRRCASRLCGGGEPRALETARQLRLTEHGRTASLALFLEESHELLADEDVFATSSASTIIPPFPIGTDPDRL